jgi:hypothetical protein
MALRTSVLGWLTLIELHCRNADSSTQASTTGGVARAKPNITISINVAAPKKTATAPLQGTVAARPKKIWCEPRRAFECEFVSRFGGVPADAAAVLRRASGHG